MKKKPIFKEFIHPVIHSAAGVLIALLVAYTFRLNISNSKLANSNDSLLTYNAYIEYQKDSIDKVCNILHKENKQKDSTIVVIDKQYKKYKLENIHLQSKLTELENNMSNITPDSSYKYLMHRYIPNQNIYPYKFAPNQIKSIHYDLLKGDILSDINTNLSSSLSLSESMYSLKSDMYNNCSKENTLLNYKVNLITKQNDNLTKVINNKDNQNKWFKIGLYGTLGALGTSLIYILIK